MANPDSQAQQRLHDSDLLGRKVQGHITADWESMVDRIDGVRVREVRNVVTGNSHITELFRVDWGIVENEVQHIIHVALRAGTIAGWHRHELQTDHIFVISGVCKLVLFDPRHGSPTHGQVDVFNLSPMRPTLVVVPPGVWHAIQSMASDTSSFINFFDRPYVYEDPDEYTLPADSPEIPYRF